MTARALLALIEYSSPGGLILASCHLTRHRDNHRLVNFRDTGNATIGKRERIAGDTYQSPNFYSLFAIAQ